MSCAAVILTHHDPTQVQRLISALAGFDIFLHCDSKTPDRVLAAMTDGAPADLRIVPRRHTTRMSWSLVDAELSGLQAALLHSSAEHIIVMSGNCYPLVPVAEIEDDFASWRGLSRLSMTPLPYSDWSTPRNPDGGYWRFRRRFVTLRDQTISVRGVPLRTLRREIPPELVLHGGSQWKIYAREHAAKLLAILDERTDLLTFFRTSYIPEESCVGTIFRSPALARDILDDVREDTPWYIDWSGSGDRADGSPRWLNREDFPRLHEERTAPSRDPSQPDQSSDGHRKLFARKFASSERELLDRIDDQLRR